MADNQLPLLPTVRAIHYPARIAIIGALADSDCPLSIGQIASRGDVSPLTSHNHKQQLLELDVIEKATNDKQYNEYQLADSELGKCLQETAQAFDASFSRSAAAKEETIRDITC